MGTEDIIRSNQEQAVAAWINWLNQTRIDTLLETLKGLDINHAASVKVLRETLSTIKTEIIENNRGGEKGLHGFIAELAEVGIGNARQRFEGAKPNSEWVNNNSPIDIMRGTQAYQMKFSQAGGNLSLKAASDHLNIYPDFLRNGGKYMIPQDHYEKIKHLLSVPESVANKMPSTSNEFTLKQWKWVNDFFGSGEISLDDIEPSNLSYSDVQRDTIDATFKTEEIRRAQATREKQNIAYQNSKPTFSEGAKVTAVSAALEGATGLVMVINSKRKAGYRLRDFDTNDWVDIAKQTGIGVSKGGVRGASLYLLTSYTVTPYAVANAILTASFGTAELVYAYRKGMIDKTELIDRIETVCMDASVSAVSSLLGQALIPIPVVGTIIGNTIGSMVYKNLQEHMHGNEIELIQEYLQDIEHPKANLSEEMQDLVEELGRNLELYIGILDKAFALDIQAAFEGSISLAMYFGVLPEDILDTKEKVNAYFLD